LTLLQRTAIELLFEVHTSSFERKRVGGVCQLANPNLRRKTRRLMRLLS